MADLTDIQLTQEALNLAEVFGVRVRNGTARNQENNLYAIERPLRPESQFWPSTVSAPQFIGFNAQELKSRLESGREIQELPMIRQHFDNIRNDLLKVQTYLERLQPHARPKYADDVQKVITSYIPDISGFIQVADKHLNAEPA